MQRSNHKEITAIQTKLQKVHVSTFDLHYDTILIEGRYVVLYDAMNRRQIFCAFHLFDQEDDDMRQMLAIALGAVGYLLALPYLIQALSSPSRMLRLCAAWGLRSLKASEAKEAVQRALEQETDDYTILEMKKVLRSIDPSYKWDG